MKSEKRLRLPRPNKTPNLSTTAYDFWWGEGVVYLRRSSGHPEGLYRYLLRDGQVCNPASKKVFGPEIQKAYLAWITGLILEGR